MTIKEGIPAYVINVIQEMVYAADSIAISGHKNPDGDCVGSCLGLYHYIKEQYPEKTVQVYLDPIADKFLFMKDSSLVKYEVPQDIIYDLFFSLDCSEPERLDRFLPVYEASKKVICIDHHFTNTGFGDTCVVCADASSTCEVLYQLFDYNKISLACAECLYTGIVHDTGVFKHSNTKKATMEAAGALLEKGVNSSFIIDDTFYRKTYLQNQILGRALLESILMLDGRMIFSVLNLKTLKFFEVTSADLDGIIDQLRITSGVECAVFLYELENGQFKVSMRSNEIVDVSAIAKEFGGGGHIRAAGCTMDREPRDIIMNIAQRVEWQLDQVRGE